MDCRPGCGACCIAPSITTPLPGMANGKAAGVACLHLDADYRCGIFGRPERPACCGGLQPSPEMCGDTREQALAWLEALENATRPQARPDAALNPLPAAPAGRSKDTVPG